MLKYNFILPYNFSLLDFFTIEIALSKDVTDSLLTNIYSLNCDNKKA